MSENMAASLISGAVFLIFVVTVGWLVGIAWRVYGRDSMNWHTGLTAAVILSSVGGITAGIIALVITGEVTRWSLLIPAAVVVYIVRWVNAWARNREGARN